MICMVSIENNVEDFNAKEAAFKLYTQLNSFTLYRNIEGKAF